MSNSKTPKETEELHAYGLEIITALLTETLNIIKAEGGKHGKEFSDSMIMTLVASLFSTIVYNELKQSPLVDDGDPAEHILKSYRHLKESLQNSIATGFQSAFREFSQVDVDYICQIMPIPEKSKMSC